MQLEEAKQLATQLMSEHGLLSAGWKFAFNNRGRGAGLCNYTRKTIYLSRPLTQGGSYEEVKDTILHEIAHALTQGHGHDRVWQAKARSLGCIGIRCYSSATKPGYTNTIAKVAKYVGVCPNGHQSFKFRMPKREQSCGKCSPRFDRKYLFQYSLNTGSSQGA